MKLRRIIIIALLLLIFAALNVLFFASFSLPRKIQNPSDQNAEYFNNQKPAKGIVLITSDPQNTKAMLSSAYQSEPIFHTVLLGETLTSISTKYGVDVKNLIDLNNLTNGELIFTDQVLSIPSRNFKPNTSLSRATKILKNGEEWQGTTRHIYVVLSEQKLYAYEGETLVADFLISSGVAAFPTVTDKFNIWIKLDSTRMTGPGYDIPNVPWTMYFYEGYGIHGADWHNNFGVPMSHGCINMKVDDADWLYHWAEVGTIVEVVP